MARWQINLAFGSSTGLKQDAKIIANIVKAHFPNIKIREFDGTKHKLMNGLILLEKLLCTLVLQKKQMTFHIEEVYKEVAFYSAYNALFPNQEWLRSGTQAAITEKIHIFCKTHYAVEQLQKRWPHCEFTGFTSIDYFSPAARKDFSMFLHVAGKSEQKGTLPLLKAWHKNPQWPQLFVVSRQPEHASFSGNNVKVISEFLPQKELILLMNRCGIHLCPSEAEGFGHSINEALSTGSVIAVTDAAPMNEFGDEPFLFNVSERASRYMSSLNRCSVNDIENTIERILAADYHVLETMGSRNRTRYLATKKSFENRLINKLKEVFAQ